jgi:DNA-binding HxlR family transcriptional regulator
MGKLQSVQPGTQARAGHTKVTTLSSTEAHASPAKRRAAVARAMTRVQEMWPEPSSCPVRDVLERVGDTWSLLIVVRLGVAPVRFRELLRQVGSISQRMLTVTLRALERDGLVLRRVVDESPPGVEYSLTERGVTLLPAIQQLADWALQNHAAILEARSRFDVRQKATPGRTVHTLTPKGNVKRTAQRSG